MLQIEKDKTVSIGDKISFNYKPTGEKLVGVCTYNFKHDFCVILEDDTLIKFDSENVTDYELLEKGPFHNAFTEEPKPLFVENGIVGFSSNVETTF